MEPFSPPPSAPTDPRKETALDVIAPRLPPTTVERILTRAERRLILQSCDDIYREWRKSMDAQLRLRTVTIHNDAPNRIIFQPTFAVTISNSDQWGTKVP